MALETPPRQRSLVNVFEYPPSHWCWIVEIRIANSIEGREDGLFEEWGEWKIVRVGGKSHYRSETGAYKAVAAAKETFSDSVRLGIVEFRVSPKYIGYIPEADEKWIGD